MTEDKPQITVSDIDSAPTKLPSAVEKTYTAEEFDKLLNRVNELADENEELRETNKHLKVRKEAAEELNKLIGPYAAKAFYFMCGYSGIVGSLLFLSGAEFWGLEQFNLADGVLEYLVGSTAVTVIGLVGMVLTGVFVGARK